MKVTAVYWHHRKVWNRTRDNNEADRPALKIIRCTEEEQQAHDVTLELLDKSSGASLWRQ
jgi:DNA polymerase-3 subunit epsilon